VGVFAFSGGEIHFAAQLEDDLPRECVVLDYQVKFTIKKEGERVQPFSKL